MSENEKFIGTERLTVSFRKSNAGSSGFFQGLYGCKMAFISAGLIVMKWGEKMYKCKCGTDRSLGLGVSALSAVFPILALTPS